MTKGFGNRTLTAALLAPVLCGGLIMGRAAAEDSPVKQDPAASAVPADQTGKGEKEAKVGALKAGRILILGNSITLHGPAKQVGWSGNWGMAASALEKDYAHLLLDHVAAAAGRRPESMIGNIAEFERKFESWDQDEQLKKYAEFKADIIVVAIGENVPDLPSDDARARFRKAFGGLLARLKKDAAPAIFVRSSFWPAKAKDDVLRQACQDAGGVFVDISQLGADESLYARSERKFENAGVAAHPGDKGMQAIADHIWKAIAARAGVGSKAESTGK